MDLDGYFNRIGYRGSAQPTIATLHEVHRLHATSIPYENIDVVLEVPVDQSQENIYDKIVGRGRGGWCYEMNGLLGWALSEIGFNVTRMCGAVMRNLNGDAAFGNHLVLRVDFEASGEAFIADVGLGDGIFEAIPFREGEFAQGTRQFRLERLDGDEWRFHNREGGIPPSFDFRSGPKDEQELAATCDMLQADPESMFRQNLIVLRLSEEGVHFLLGRMHTMPNGERRILETEDEFVAVLTKVIGIKLPKIDGLWSRVVERHEELFGNTPASEISMDGPAD